MPWQVLIAAMILCSFGASGPSVREAIGSNPVAVVHVPDNATLLGKSTLTYPTGVWRDGYASTSDGGLMLYFPGGSPCSLNSGNGDNGSEVKSADGKCWV